MLAASRVPDPKFSYDELRSSISRYEQVLREIVLVSNRRLDEWARSAPEIFMDLRPGAISFVFNDLVCAEAERRCAGVQGLKVVKAHGRRLVIVEERLRLRFKKIDSNGRSRNLVTPRQAKLYGQPVQLILDPDIVPRPPVSLLDATLGWVWDATRTTIDDIQVVFAPNHNLNFSVGGTSIAVAEVTPSTPAASSTAKKARVVVRKEKQIKEEQAS